MRLVFVLFLLYNLTFSQVDSVLSVPMFGVRALGQLPGGDMVNRFGANLNAGGAFMYKTNKNWVYSFDAGYIFGKRVKEDVTRQLKTAEGFIIDNEGYAADLRISQRGLALQLSIGKLIPINKRRRNSGILLSVGFGYLQHKINLYDAQQKIAAIKGELKYGYDRLSNGLMISQFVGYMILSKNRLLNIYMGIEGAQAFTKSVRKFNFDTGLTDTKQRLDILTGLKFGWILPLYKKTPNEFYFD
jgi:hypothetical protein